MSKYKAFPTKDKIHKYVLIYERENTATETYTLGGLSRRGVTWGSGASPLEQSPRDYSTRPYLGIVIHEDSGCLYWTDGDSETNLMDEMASQYYQIIYTHKIWEFFELIEPCLREHREESHLPSIHPKNEV